MLVMAEQLEQQLRIQLLQAVQVLLELLRLRLVVGVVG